MSTPRRNVVRTLVSQGPKYRDEPIIVTHYIDLFPMFQDQQLAKPERDELKDEMRSTIFRSKIPKIEL